MFANNIKQFREDQGLTQSRLARAAGVSQSTVHRIEVGEFDPKFSTMIRIADALGVKVDELIMREPGGDERHGH